MITVYEVLQIFYDDPGSTYFIDGKTLKHIILKKQGKMISKGRLWRIENEKVGPDVYRIWLENIYAKRS